MVTTAATEVSGPQERSAGTVARTWSTTRDRVLAAVLDLSVAVAASFAVGLSPVKTALAALLWPMLTGASVPIGLSRRRALRGVLFAASVAGLGCWVAGALALLSVPDDRLVVLVGLLTLGSALVRLGRPADARSLRVLVIGAAGDRDSLAAILSQLTAGRMTAVGCCEPAVAADAVRSEDVDGVLAVPGPGFDGRPMQRLAWDLEALGVPFFVSTRLHDVAPARTETLRVGTLGVLRVAPPRRNGVRHRVWCLAERTAAALGLLLLAPLLFVVAAAIRLDSPGPVLFRQVRVGRDGQCFTMFKFRTMCVDAETRLAELRARADVGNAVLFKLREDPRVTRVGRVLRQYSLDELPQLINVVRGEMALVGPRPALPSELEQYDHDPRRRLAVTPGITGLWQVSGRSDLSWEESVRLDLDYVDNWSLGRDIAILLRTVRAVFRHSGAY